MGWGEEGGRDGLGLGKEEEQEVGKGGGTRMDGWGKEEEGWVGKGGGMMVGWGRYRWEKKEGMGEVHVRQSIH